MSVDPSPKSHAQEVGVPVDKSVKVTILPWQKVESLAENSAAKAAKGTW